MDVPSMVQRSGDTLIVRSVVSGDQLYIDQQENCKVSPTLSTTNDMSSQNMLSLSATKEQLERLQQFGLSIEGRNNNHNNNTNNNNSDLELDTLIEKDEGLPQCKIKRNYSCSTCSFFTQNPRFFLTHLRDKHGEKIVINECKLCLYASRHYQKLVRHMKMVHGSTEGIEDHAHARKRQMGRETRKRKVENNNNNTNTNNNNNSPIIQSQSQTLPPTDIYIPTIQQIHQQQTQYQQLLAISHQQTQQQQQQQQQQQHEQHISSPQLIKPTLINDIAIFDDCSGKNRLLKCSLCDFTTLYRGQLMEHENDVHCKTKFFRCEKCSYVTHIKTRFSKHVKYHSMPMIKCVTCDFRTPYKWNLDRHMKNHGGSGTFKCVACNFTADIKQSLTVHEMNHHIPPVGHASGMSLTRRRNKVGGTDVSDTEDIISESGDIEDILNYYKALQNNNTTASNNNNIIDEFVDSFNGIVNKKFKLNDNDNDDDDDDYEDQPTDLSQKINMDTTPKTPTTPNRNTNNGGEKKLTTRRPIPNLIPMQPAAIAALSAAATTTSHNNNSSLLLQNHKNAGKHYNDGNQQLLPRDVSSADKMRQLAQVVLNNNTDSIDNMYKISQLSPASSTSNNSSSGTTSNSSKKKSSNMFEKLKERFALEGADTENLICGGCGHISKCLSELMLHRNTCKKLLAYQNYEKHSRSSPINLSINSTTGSTRCQYCRHRCKSSTDLVNHLRSCQEASLCINDSGGDSLSDCVERNYDDGGGGDLEDNSEIIQNEQNYKNDDDGIEEDRNENINQHPMENRVFVWNQIPEIPNNNNNNIVSSSLATPKKLNINVDNLSHHNNNNSLLSPNNSDLKNDENSYYGVETAPGYGEVTKKMTAEEEAANSSLKKVYKCPHCSFWASTASRFHVHIVGHLNKKPFECSLCNYRSNWRWDITKHIRLKTIRDPSHKSAKVLMNDETGRRNYTKYNKYITLMKVTEEDGDPKLMKSGEMTPNQEASLAFLKDFDTKNHINLMTNNNNNSGSSSNINCNDEIINNRKQLELLRQSFKDDSPRSIFNEQQQQKQDERFNQIQFSNSMTSGSVSNLTRTDNQRDSSISGSAVKRSPPDLIKASSLLYNSITTDNDGSEKNKLFRCKECNYKNASREMLVAHVKQHTMPAFNFLQQQQQKQQQENQQQLFQKLSQNLGAPLDDGGVNSSPYGNSVHDFITALFFHHQQQANVGNSRSDQEIMQHVHNLLTNNGGNMMAAPITGLMNAGGNKTLGRSILVNPLSGGNNNEHGEMDEASSTNGVVTTTTTTTSTTTITTSNNPALVNGNSNPTNANAITTDKSGIVVTTATIPSSGGLINSGGSNHDIQNNDSQWRGPAPYRCGHCHQVSNWKHVIQRHCRLKHNGDIRIETIDRSSDRHAPAVYRPLGLAQSLGRSSQNNNHSNHHQNVLTRNKDLIKTSTNNSTSSNNSHQIKTVDESSTKWRGFSDSVLNKHPNLIANLNDNVLTNGSGNFMQSTATASATSTKSKQQQCPSCTYVSESKSQMNYHISLHKANQYECNTCGYLCSKKQELNHHIKIIHDNNNNNNNDGAGGKNNIYNQNPRTTLPGSSSSASLYPIETTVINDNDDENDNLVMDLDHNSDQEMEEKDTKTQIVDKILYCHKCPARYLKYHDLIEHKKCHLLLNRSDIKLLYHCDYCTFGTAHETILQSHTVVHNDEYQNETKLLSEKLSNDFENYPPPNLHQTKEGFWIVRSTEGDSINNNNNNNYVGCGEKNKDSLFMSATSSTSSLLKRQLETKRNYPRSSNSSPKNNQTTDLILNKNMKSLDENEDDYLTVEKCPYCPYETKQLNCYKIHLKCHFCVSKFKGEFTCDHCDFSNQNEQILQEHIKCHFQIYDNCKSVAFYTSYDSLELNLIKQNDKKFNINQNNFTTSKETLTAATSTSNNNSDLNPMDTITLNNAHQIHNINNSNKKLLYKSDNNVSTTSNNSNSNNDNNVNDKTEENEENNNNNINEDDDNDNGGHTRKIVDFITGQILAVEPIANQ